MSQLWKEDIAPTMKGDQHATGLPPLAIIGMAMRFPQGADSAEAFWDMLISKTCASTDIPSDRMNISAYFHPDQGRLDAMSQRGGHFIKGNLAAFDAPFFSIGAAEAEAMDPGQRFTLETAYQAIENAGIPIERIAGTKTCVFTGCFNNDYGKLSPKDPADPPKYDTVGTQMSILANRVSWFFDLVGPSANVDTACSSSLMALDLVCQSIWQGDSSMGLACGSNILLSPEFMASMDNLGFLSKDSRCFSFDHRANGYARGEGFGVLVIKPLQDALHDGDTIRAVIRSSASNQDGKTPSLTQPSKESQERLIRHAYRKAGLDFNSTRYFEAHGTGTPVGDPIEAGAIGAVFRSQRSHEDPLYVGSVKANIGHLEGASGVAGVIKVILSLEKGVIPPNTNFERLNPKIDADFLNIKIPTEAVSWPSKGLRRASIQSFGFGGSNSHVIIDDAYNYLLLNGLRGHHNTVPEPPTQPPLLQFSANPTNGNGLEEVNGVSSVSHSELDTRILVWSTADEAGVARLTEIWREYFTRVLISNEVEDSYLQDLAYTLASRRTHFPWRTFVVAKGRKNIKDIADLMTTSTKAATSPKLAFIFTGQGAQWYAMGRELIDRYPVFRNSLVHAGLYLKSLGCPWNLLDEMLKDRANSNVNDTEYSQSLCTALQVALVDLLDSFGVRPTAVVGHSSGEIAAAYAAKALNRQSAWKVSYYRGLLAAQLGQTDTMKWGMVSVGLSRDSATPYLERVSAELGSTRLAIACVNSPKNLTISGDSAHLDHLQALLQPEQIFNRRLKVTVAYHSFQMKAIADQYLSCLSNLTGQSSQKSKSTPVMVSSVTGEWVDAQTVQKAEYWISNMVQPVLYSDALAKLCSQSSANIVKKLDGSHHRLIFVNQLIEIGPHAALQGPSKDILRSIGREKDIGYMSLLRRNISAVNTTLEAAGQMYCVGYPINLARVNNQQFVKSSIASPKTLTSLPVYSFNHSKTFWHESRLSRENRFRHFGRMDLLGAPSQDWNPFEAHWRNIIRLSELPWLEDHKINGVILYPAVGMVVKVVEAAKQLADSSREVKGFVVKNINFHSAINIPTGSEGVEVNTYLRPRNNADHKPSGWFDVRICTYDGKGWIENCNGSVQIVYVAEHSEIDGGLESEVWRKNHVQRYQDSVSKCTTKVDAESLYNHLSNSGYSYGPTFRSITSVAFDGRENIVSEVKTFQWSNYEAANVAQSHIIHPTTFDGIFQTIFAVYTKGGTGAMSTSIPTHINRLWLSAKGLSHPNANSIKVYANTLWTGLRGTESTITALDATGCEVLIEMQGAKTTLISSVGDADGTEKQVEDKCYNIDWKPDLDLLSVESVQAFCDTAVIPEPEPVDFYTDVDSLLTAVAQRALVVKDKLLESLKPTDHIKRYLDWIEHRMQGPPHDEYVAQLVQKIASENKQGAFFATICENLLEFLTGRIDATDILSDGDLVKDYSYELWDSLPCLKRLSCYLDAHVHKTPNAKILEVGAGTGAMTHQLMKTLAIHGEDGYGVPRFSCFDYTDISTSSFGSAGEKYRGFGNRMQFKSLNIAVDPESQGYELGTYDIVVAAMVLHATEDLLVTLANCRKLLRPGGKLILLELTQPKAFRTAFVFGLLDGWWSSSEEYRKWSPCVDVNKWHELLKQNGFSGSETVLHDYDNSICHEFSVIISTAQSELPVMASDSKLVIIYGSEQEQLAQDIQKEAEVHGSFTVQSATIEQVLKQPPDADAVVVFLLELKEPVWLKINSELFDRLRKILSSASKVLWVARGGGFKFPEPEFRIIDGLFRVLNSEFGNSVYASLSLETEGTLSSQQKGHIVQLARLFTTSQDIDTEYIEHKGLLHISRLIAADNLNKLVFERQLPQQKQRQQFGSGAPLRLNIRLPGMLSSLEFVEDKGKDLDLHPDEIEIQVKGVGLNFQDIQIALGRLSQGNIGIECVGTITRLGKNCEGLAVGNRVAVICQDSFKSYVRVNYRSVAKIPDSIPFSVAAAIPVSYSVAWYSLYEIARVQPGETVLIHSGAGGIGQAAIQVAQYLGATVFATVSTKEKKQLLTEKYKIPAENIFSSRDTVFAESIKRLTLSLGVDVVLNSLSNEGLVASWESIAPYGRFIQISKKDIHHHSTLPMFSFARSATFCAVDIAAMSLERPYQVRKTMEEVFSLIEMGALAPSEPLQVYGVSELEKAFREMQGGKNFGKIVIDFKADDYVETILDTRPTFSFDLDATYVIAGGLGGLGRNVSRWFVERGARNLILLSRSGPKSRDAQAFVADLTSLGACVRTPPCNISDLDALRNALNQCLSDMPPVKGCIQSSMVLRDGTFEGMTFQSWEMSTLPKVQGTWNLHTLLPKGMDFFIMFSSISGIFGNRGQSNYAAGNTYMDAIAKYRIANGEQGSSIDLGLFLSAGVLNEDKGLLGKFLAKSFFNPMTEPELFALLEYYCNINEQHGNHLQCQTVVLDIAAGQRERGADSVYWLKKPQFRHIIMGEMKEADGAQAEKMNFKAVFAAASSLAEAIMPVTEALVKKIANTLSLAEGELDSSRPLHNYGVDSLVSVELRNWFLKELQADIAIFDILGGASISSVAALAVAKSKYRKAIWVG